jgi:hypothetical protein
MASLSQLTFHFTWSVDFSGYNKKLLQNDRMKYAKGKVKFILQLVVNCQSVHLGAKPLEAHDQRFFFSTEPLQS